MLRLGLAVLLALATACTGDDSAAPAGDTSTTGVLDGPITTRVRQTTTTAERDVDDTAARRDGPWLLAAEDLANAAGLPRILVSDGDTIRRIDRGIAVRVVDPDERIGTAVGDGTGTVFYEIVRAGQDGVAEAVDIARIDASGDRRLLQLAPRRSVQLHDVVRIGPTTSVVYALFREPGAADDEPTGSLIVQDPASGRSTRIADAAAPNLLLDRVAAATDLYVLTYITGDSERVEFVDLAGEPIERPSPTDDLDRRVPAVVSSAVVSADGVEVAYVIGPADPDADDAADRTAGESSTVADWQVVIDDDDGEQLRFSVADRSLAYVTIDFDGRWLLVSGGDESGPVEALLIDTEAADLATYLLEGVPGEARLETVAVPGQPG